MPACIVESGDPNWAMRQCCVTAVSAVTLPCEELGMSAEVRSENQLFEANLSSPHSSSLRLEHQFYWQIRPSWGPDIACDSHHPHFKYNIGNCLIILKSIPIPAATAHPTASAKSKIDLANLSCLKAEKPV